MMASGSTAALASGVRMATSGVPPPMTTARTSVGGFAPSRVSYHFSSLGVCCCISQLTARNSVSFASLDSYFLLLSPSVRLTSHLFPSLSGSGCETFWDTDPLTDSCYQFNFQATLSWSEARISCQQQGADLLSITKLHEQTYINGKVDVHLCEEVSTPVEAVCFFLCHQRL